MHEHAERELLRWLRLYAALGLVIAIELALIGVRVWLG